MLAGPQLRTRNLCKVQELANVSSERTEQLMGGLYGLRRSLGGFCQRVTHLRNVTHLLQYNHNAPRPPVAVM